MWVMQEHYCPEQLVMKINALYLTVFTAYKIDHLINETGISTVMARIRASNNNKYSLLLACEAF
ncbi:hypothetical protein [Thalassotalea piscium]|uniref:Uncharacterized protein n=1 Tax=Thalassotalea piscium TaxID=1230533 RepID=A0A7X0NHD8_9GAMM|nr:hypothetical protein [Thalassotalea piscium]MBB6543351.1 hypothetical protein [Thalassotalea piscium]